MNRQQLAAFNQILSVTKSHVVKENKFEQVQMDKTTKLIEEFDLASDLSSWDFAKKLEELGFTNKHFDSYNGVERTQPHYYNDDLKLVVLFALSGRKTIVTA